MTRNNQDSDSGRVLRMRCNDASYVCVLDARPDVELSSSSGVSFRRAKRKIYQKKEKVGNHLTHGGYDGGRGHLIAALSSLLQEMRDTISNAYMQ